MLRNIEIKPFKAEYVVRDITRAGRHLENAGSAVNPARKRDRRAAPRRPDRGRITGKHQCSRSNRTCNVQPGRRGAQWEPRPEDQRRTHSRQGRPDTGETGSGNAAPNGTLLKMMNGGIKEPRGAPYHNVVEPEGTWTRRLVLALRAEEALRSGLVEGSGPFERLARHERAEELAPRLRRSTAGKAREIQALARNLPTKLNNQIRTEITKWSNTYTRIAQETPNTTPGKKRDEEGLNPRMRG